jgi:hypothetical protein
MSIATLKKKTQSKYNNISVGESQFSINGTHRNQGYVGQTSLSRSLPKTPMKGNVYVGHGGCCGKFVKMPIVQSAVISLENPNIVKSSVLGTSGLISTKYKWIKRPQPYSTFKPDDNQNMNSQSDYIKYLVDKQNQLTNTEPCNNKTEYTRISSCNLNNNFNKTINNNNSRIKTCNISKPGLNYNYAIPCGEYMRRLIYCRTKDDMFYVASKNNKQPFAGFN